MKEQILLDIIDLLKDQLQQANSRIGSLISQVEALTLQLSSLEESIRAKDNDIQQLLHSTPKREEIIIPNAKNSSI